MIFQRDIVSLMWNKAFKKAYDDKCDYFFQCGDDIEFMDKGWINDSIYNLQQHNNFGLTDPLIKEDGTVVLYLDLVVKDLYKHNLSFLENIWRFLGVIF